MKMTEKKAITKEGNEALLKQFLNEIKNSPKKKRELLLNYFQDDIIVKGILDTLSETELNNWLGNNMNELLKVGQGKLKLGLVSV